ncbi:hypothetical protein SEA_PERIWINKLE_61 [Gordonia phage Periwinkle]|nr:hypothetical protein SEA_PERIWINKLE_61 [Gordonia phage Periwinkle]
MSTYSLSEIYTRRWLAWQPEPCDLVQVPRRSVEGLLAEVDRQRTALDKVRELHKRIKSYGWGDDWYCGTCLIGNHDEPLQWPCPTAELAYSADELGMP